MARAAFLALAALARALPTGEHTGALDTDLKGLEAAIESAEQLPPQDLERGALPATSMGLQEAAYTWRYSAPSLEASQGKCTFPCDGLDVEHVSW